MTKLTVEQERDEAVKALREIVRLLIKYQRDEDVILFRDSHKCRRIAEEALAKCSK